MRHTVVVGNVVNDNTGITVQMPVILTDRGPLVPFAAYLHAHSHIFGPSWMTKATQAVRLLLDYMDAHRDAFTNPQGLFRGFVQALYAGTPDDDGFDPSGLYWMPSSSRSANGHAKHVERFTDWLSSYYGTQPLNPWRTADHYEEMLAWAAYHKRRDNSFLKHAMSKGTASKAVSRARELFYKRPPKGETGQGKDFPESRVRDLLVEGFIVPGNLAHPDIAERFNLRDILITLLQHYGGIRRSEAFHLYHHDVTRGDWGVAQVRIFHPSEGAAPGDFRDANGRYKTGIRAEYLRVKHGMRPRNMYPSTDSLYAGWKDPALDNLRHKFIQVTWSRAQAGRLFYALWTRYMEQRLRLNPEHPFAFVTKRGRPYSVRDYSDAHKRAVERIGLIASKELGTTPHGHRHAYGQHTRRADLHPAVAQRAMHHKSITSQSAYTAPTVAEVNEAMTAAEARLDGEISLGLEDFMEHGFEDVDPQGLLSGPYPKLLHRKRS